MSTQGDKNEFETYDLPKTPTPVSYYCSKNVCQTPTDTMGGRQYRLGSLSPAINSSATSIEEESYDVPRPLNSTLTPSSSRSSLLTNNTMSLSYSSSNVSSLTYMADYDIPQRNPIPVRPYMDTKQFQQTQPQQQQQQQQQSNGNDNIAIYDYPVPLMKANCEQYKLPMTAAAAIVATKELPLEMCSALETLDKLQSETTTAITKLLSFVSPDWRARDNLKPIIMEVKLATVRLRTALHDLTEFSEGALGNATRTDDRNLTAKLRPLVRAMRDADKLVQDTTDVLDKQRGWTLENLTRDSTKTGAGYKPPDSLDQLVACAQTLTEDVRQAASFIQGNALLLFECNMPQTHANDSAKGEWLEDYDYVSFESKDAAAKKNVALREAIPSSQKKNFDTVLRAAETNAMAMMATNATKTKLSNNDQLVVRYYAAQIANHIGYLLQAIDSFLETIAKNQPPKFFIAYGKFVVVSAHNLVTIGDIVHRNLSKVDLQEKILRCTDALSDALKTCVIKSKKAASHFPSVTAVQEMVDAVMDISHLATDLKTAMLHASQ